MALHAALIAMALVVLAPFVWVIAAGFRTQISLLTGEFFFTPTLAAFQDVLFSKSSDFILNFRNSVIVAVLATPTIAAWSLHRMRWPGWVVHLFLAWALVFHMIPPITMSGGWFAMFRALGLDNTFTAIVLAHVTLNLPMAIWLMSVFVREVPDDLVQAVLVQAATQLGVAIEAAIRSASDDPLDRIEAVVRAVFRPAVRRPALLGLIREVSRLSPAVGERFQSELRPLVDRAVAYLHKEMDRGRIRQADPRSKETKILHTSRQRGTGHDDGRYRVVQMFAQDRTDFHRSAHQR